MTGGQEPVVPSERLLAIVLGLGVNPEHCHVVEPHPRRVSQLAELIRKEIEVIPKSRARPFARAHRGVQHDEQGRMVKIEQAVGGPTSG